MARNCGCDDFGIEEDKTINPNVKNEQIILIFGYSAKFDAIIEEHNEIKRQMKKEGKG